MKIKVFPQIHRIRGEKFIMHAK